MTRDADRQTDRETDRVAERYARRAAADDRYRADRPDIVRLRAERRRGVRALFAAAGHPTLAGLEMVEVGCGSGGNLLELIEQGAEAARLTGIELLPERAALARARLPAAVRVIEGDALAAPVAPRSVDVVLAFTVFSSLLDDAFQERLARAMAGWLRPRGAVLWYDFAVGNPRNPDVRGMPLARVRALFPQARITVRRVTLAPPIARAAVRIHPALYTAFDALPWLRTHRLCWIEPHPT